MKRLATLVVALAVLAAAPACGGPGGRQFTADFATAVAFYPGSKVKVMGVDVGEVTDVDLDDGIVHVTFRVKDDVPVPADVRAAIVPLTLVGERNLVLFPAWKPGDAEAPADFHIGLDRTEVPVETDEALQSFTDLASAVDPDALNRLAVNGAAALEGRGQQLNETITELRDLTTLFASQDEQLVAVATNLRDLVATLSTREQQLAQVIDQFASVSGVLAAEREGLVDFLDAVAAIPREGQLLLADLEDDLAVDLARLLRLSLILDANTGNVRDLLAGLGDAAVSITDAYDPQSQSIIVRGIADGTFGALLGPLFEALGLPIPTCSELSPNVTCP